MYLSIIILPLLGSIVSGFFGRKVGISGSRIVSCLGIIVTAVFAIIAFFEVGFNCVPVVVNLSRWVDSELFNILWNFEFDSLTVIRVIIFPNWYNFAVLVIIQLYKWIFIKKSFISHLRNNSDRYLYLNVKTKNRNLFFKGISQIRNFSTLKTEKDAPDFLSEEKLGGSSEKENFLQWFVGFSDAESNFIINPILKKDKVTISSFSFMFKITLRSFHQGAKEKEIYNFSNPDTNLNPHWVTGFVDAEGCFMITIRKQLGSRGWGVTAAFSLNLHAKDSPLLKKIQSFFRVGKIHIGKKAASFTVRRIDDITNVIIPHFKQYPLQSAKSIDFQLWSQCVEMIANKEHLSLSGLNKIVGIKSALNLGLSEDLKQNFKDANLMVRPAFRVNSNPLNPYWISGFSEGDSSFFVSISAKTNQVRMFYNINLNNRELPLIIKIQEYFGGIGNISYYDKNNLVQYIIASNQSINETIVPQFDTYMFCGNKLTNYLIWKEILLLVNSKAHLTTEGLNTIIGLKSKLNQW